MGHESPETEPGLGECPNCCENLPNTLHCRFTHPDLPPFSGSLEKDEDVPCMYAGLMTNGEDGGIPVFLGFCADGPDAAIICGPPLVGFCGGATIPNNHCNPGFSATTPTGCRYEVWA